MKNKKLIFNILITIIVLSIILVVYLMLKKEKVSIPPTLTIDNKVVNLFVGDEYTINYKFEDNGNNITLKWNVSNNNVISLNDNKVKALSKGVSEVSISYFYNEKEFVNKIVFIVDEYDKEAPVIKVDGNIDENTWVNHDVNLKINIDNETNYELFYYIEGSENKEEKVNNNNILINNDGTNIVHIKAIDSSNNKSEVIVKVNIDKTEPTCSLKLNDKTIEITKSDNNELSYYGTNKDFTGKNVNSLEAKEGKFNYYVKDIAGNTGKCSITLVKKMLYRKSTCTKCNNCKEAGCKSYTEWHTTGSHCNNKTSASDYVGEYEKYTNCRYDTSCSSGNDTGDKERPDKFYRCTRAIRSCREYVTSCEKCGCASWSEYGEWTDQVIKEDRNTKVQKQERLYQK